MLYVVAGMIGVGLAIAGFPVMTPEGFSVKNTAILVASTLLWGLLYFWIKYTKS